MLKLHTIEEVHAMLPKNSVTLAELTRLIIEHGTYRAIGKGRLLTQDDVRVFLDRMSATRSRPLSPPRNALGLIVFIGNPAGGKDHSMFVQWCLIGHELDMLDRLSEGARERLMILGTANATPAMVERFRVSHAKSWDFGYWFTRTEEFMDGMRALTEDEDGEDDGNGDVSKTVGGQG